MFQENRIWFQFTGPFLGKKKKGGVVFLGLALVFFPDNSLPVKLTKSHLHMYRVSSEGNLKNDFFRLVKPLQKQSNKIPKQTVGNFSRIAEPFCSLILKYFVGVQLKKKQNRVSEQH